MERTDHDPRIDWNEYMAAHRRSMQRAAQRCALFAQGRTCSPTPEEMRAEAIDQEIMRVFVVRRLTTLR